jgi:ketosteroid isomerase-like protein
VKSEILDMVVRDEGGIMRPFFIALTLSAAVTCAPNSASAERPEQLTSDASLLAFLEQLAEATHQFNVGNSEPYLALLSASEELTLMGAGGGMEKGISQIAPRLRLITQRRREAAGFEENRAEIDYVSIISSGAFAYTVQFERRQLSGGSANTPNELRATHVLRKEDGQWKLLHRQADNLVPVTIPGVTPPRRQP